MRRLANRPWPPDKRGEAAAAERLEWLTIAFLLSIVTVIALTMGSSQAMKTAWIEDLLGLIPPIVYLVASRYASRPPDADHPYGYQRALQLSFLAAAVALIVFGGYMLYDASVSLFSRHHPTIGHFALLGQSPPIWAGWPMIAALVYSMLPPMLLGRRKLRIARSLHLKTLYADAAMNKDDWLTAAAAILGIIGIGFGLWWADAAAAAFISLNVLKDGATSTLRALGDLVDGRPRDVERRQPLGLEQRIADGVGAMPEVAAVSVRLREDGPTFRGELFVVPAGPQCGPATVARIARTAESIDWRLHEIAVMLVSTLDDAARIER